MKKTVFSVIEMVALIGMALSAFAKDFPAAQLQALIAIWCKISLRD
jgi:hypothetical protein